MVDLPIRTQHQEAPVPERTGTRRDTAVVSEVALCLGIPCQYLSGVPSMSMDSTEKAGHDAIADAVSRLEPPVIVIEMHRQLGDILHSSIAVRNIRATTPGCRVVWAISRKYEETFKLFVPDDLGPHGIALLPELPPYPGDGSYRIRWVESARSLPGVVRAFGCGVHPWGWSSGTIADAVLSNSGIKSGDLVVPRRPFLPIDQSDLDFADEFISKHGLVTFATMEYTSYTLHLPTVDWYARIAARLKFPIVAIAGSEFPVVPGTIDCRSSTFRQAKALISRSSCFIGSGSGLSVMAASIGCEQNVVEIIPHDISMPGLGYRRAGDRHVLVSEKTPEDVADAVNGLVLGTHVIPRNQDSVSQTCVPKSQGRTVRIRKNRNVKMTRTRR